MTAAYLRVHYLYLDIFTDYFPTAQFQHIALQIALDENEHVRRDPFLERKQDSASSSFCLSMIDANNF